MKKLTLETVLNFGKFKGKTVKQYADENWYGFKNWYKSKPHIFDYDVDDYVYEINTTIYKLTKR